MRVDDFTAPVNEIFLVPQSNFVGNFLDRINYQDHTANTVPMPGFSNLLLSFDNNLDTLYVLNPKEKIVIAKMTLWPVDFPSGQAKARAVQGIAVNPKYRKIGVASTLYQIALRSLKRVLVSDDVQTPGGARNWLSINKLPGVEVLGYIAINMKLLGQQKYKETGDRLAQELLELGGVYFGKKKQKNYYYFPVQEDTGLARLRAEVKQKIIKLYGSDGESFEIGVFARWVGR